MDRLLAAQIAHVFAREARANTNMNEAARLLYNSFVWQRRAALPDGATRCRFPLTQDDLPPRDFPSMPDAKRTFE